MKFYIKKRIISAQISLLIIFMKIILLKDKTTFH